MGIQAPNLLNQSDSKTSSNDTKEANTFLINVNNSNHSDNDKGGESQHITHLGSANHRIATAVASNNETNHTSKIQTSKFM